MNCAVHIYVWCCEWPQKFCNTYTGFSKKGLLTPKNQKKKPNTRDRNGKPWQMINSLYSGELFRQALGHKASHDTLGNPSSCTITCIQGSTKAITRKKHFPQGLLLLHQLLPQFILCCSERTLVLLFLFFLVFYWSQGACLQSLVLWWPWFLLHWGSPIASERKLSFHLLNKATQSLHRWPGKRMHIGQLNLPLMPIVYFSVSHLPLQV